MSQLIGPMLIMIGGSMLGYSVGFEAGKEHRPSDDCARAGTERQLSPHETQHEPIPALAPGRWIDERYEL